MITNVFLWAIVAVDERRVGFPGVWGLVSQLLAARVKGFDSAANFAVYSFFNLGKSIEYFFWALSDVLDCVSGVPRGLGVGRLASTLRPS